MHKLNCLGLPPFRNTNRAKPAYRRSKDRRARAKGFLNHAHQELFWALLRVRGEKQ